MNSNEKHSEKTALINKLSEATMGLEEALLYIKSLQVEQDQLKRKLALLEQELKIYEQYKQRIDRIRSTWYGQFAFCFYRILKRIKNFL
jgi:predicted nuclease with TOPRIM domain